ncbi:MFS transporter [Nocardiopsis sp. N85]|uniref:MFS transporter n=1 Tax=Nocardiopsis sp. N85 TaxID=3029400 RepID=UPI00237FB482|nr:MFS transporter [Nocardiopsis sp. N85]MDE3720436.1 MFS transporter [Nocardiopsis sp. N85]
MTAPPHTTRPDRRALVGLAVLALPTLLLSIDMSVLHLALPHMVADLSPTGPQLLWAVDVYGFMIAGLLVTMGTLGDRIGRRRLLLIGAAVFGAASALAAFSPTVEVLIATRALMGVAGATLMPSTLGLISGMFPDPRHRAAAIAVWTSCFMGGTALGPMVGGVLLHWFWWGSVFLLGVPVMALLLVCGPLLLPEQRADHPGRLDLVSVVLSLAAVLPAVYGLKVLADGAPPTLPLLAIAAGLIAGVVFVRRQLHLADPLLDLRLFRAPAFGTALAVMMGGAVAMGGTFLLISQYFQLVAGYPPLIAGLWLVPPSAAMIVATLLAPPLAARVGRATVIGGGMFVTAAGFVVLSLAPVQDGAFVVMIGLLLASIGLGPGAALIADIVVGSAPPERAGAAASLSETSGELGIALGVALMGSLSAAVYRAGVEPPAGVPEEAGHTLAGAVAVARDLPADLAAALLGPAREAFTAGLNLAGVLGAIAMALGGAAALVLLRTAEEPAETDESGDAAGSVRVNE